MGDLRDELEYSTKYNDEKVLEGEYEAQYVRKTLQLCREEIFPKEEAWKQKTNFLKTLFSEKRKFLEAERISRKIHDEWSIERKHPSTKSCAKSPGYVTCQGGEE